ncbi:MAG: hypothetical protein GY795_42865 [Desulfobacterales bacterium]|nr:hypothetical protein [Desulfobacterales bacterium]
MSVVYKYFSADMLASMGNMLLAEAQRLLDGIAEWTFIKYNAQTKSYQLHDLVRDLIVKYIQPNLDPTKYLREDICRKTVEHDNKLIKETEDKEEKWRSTRKKAEAANNKIKSMEALRKLVKLKKTPAIPGSTNILQYTL